MCADLPRSQTVHQGEPGGILLEISRKETKIHWQPWLNLFKGHGFSEATIILYRRSPLF